MHIIICLVVPPIKLIGGVFNSGTGLSASILPFANRTTGSWSNPYFTNSECAAKGTFIDEVSISLSLHASVAFLYCENISHSHIIPAGWCHIKNWYISL